MHHLRAGRQGVQAGGLSLLLQPRRKGRSADIKTRVPKATSQAAEKKGKKPSRKEFLSDGKPHALTTTTTNQGFMEGAKILPPNKGQNKHENQTQLESDNDTGGGGR